MATVAQRQGALARQGLERILGTDGRRRIRRIVDRPVGEKPAILGKIKTVGEAWMEYAHGIGGNKPARDFEGYERNSTYSRRLPLYLLLSRLVSHGDLPATAIRKVDTVYKGVPLLQISKHIKKKRGMYANGGLHRSLWV